MPFLSHPPVPVLHIAIDMPRPTWNVSDPFTATESTESKMPTEEEETIALEPGDYEIVEEEDEVTQTYFSASQSVSQDEPEEITLNYVSKDLVDLIANHPGV